MIFKVICEGGDLTSHQTLACEHPGTACPAGCQHALLWRASGWPASHLCHHLSPFQPLKVDCYPFREERCQEGSCRGTRWVFEAADQSVPPSWGSALGDPSRLMTPHPHKAAVSQEPSACPAPSHKVTRKPEWPQPAGAWPGCTRCCFFWDGPSHCVPP